MRPKITAALNKIENTRAALAIRSGLVMLIPVLLIGAATLILQYFPITAYQNFIASFLDSCLLKIFNCIYNATFGMLSVFVTLTISYCYAKEKYDSHVYPFGAVISSLMVFFVLVGVLNNNVSWSALGVKSMFTAIMSATLTPFLYYKITCIFKTKRTPYSDGADAGFSKSISIFVPILIIVTIAAVINTILAELFAVNSFQELFIAGANAFFKPLGNSMLSGMLFVLISSILWFFGIHGSDVLEGVMEKVFTPAIDINAALAAAGQAPTEILTKEFFDVFVLIGGCGTALCLLISILLFSKRASNLRLSKLAVAPMIFNINEVMIFGLPVIFNPTLLLPFILTPLVSFFISYTAMSSGLVPLITSSIQWTTPVLLGGYQATGSLAGSLLQLVNVIVGVLIYRPFVRAYDRQKEERAKKNLADLVEIMKQSESNLSEVTLIELASSQGEIARSLALDLEYAMHHNDLIMYYQPQYNNKGQLIGTEALLRWFHPLLGGIYPPLIIELARESGMLLELEQEIIKQAIKDARNIWETTGVYTEFSINVAAETLGHSKYLSLLQKLAEEDKNTASHICLEITEQTALLSNSKTSELFKRIHAMGYKLAIDDFSMGHTSLAYLQENSFDCVKLDGGIVRGMSDNPRSKDIIASIVHLSKSLGFEVLAEYVETEKMRCDLEAIGCNLYQGYLFSPAVPKEQLLKLLDPKTS